MQQDGGVNAKQQIVEKVRSSTNILVTVSNNPSVDELSAALALTLILNKMDKHATAVFSGSIPPAISFLDPSKTFEDTVDSLRDFIIALDKEKADRLRYKVEDNVVRIFITPYRTTITEKDLDFSQGDFNVETIIALGVEKREELDQAIVAHGRILHDATVITVNARNDKSTLGSIDWQDANASSLCEMLVSITEAFQPGLLDQQISTALLTGIVAATERFSNEHTSPRVMTMSAQLMAAGANQQLIATNLQQSRKSEQKLNSDGTVPMTPDGASAKLDKKEEKKTVDGEMHVEHDKKEEKPAQQLPPPVAQTAPNPLVADQMDKQLDKLDQLDKIDQLDKQLDKLAQPATDFADLKAAIQDETPPAQAPPAPKQNKQPKNKNTRKDNYDGPVEDHPSWQGRRIEPPTLGGTLNATTEEAHENAMHTEEDERNGQILSHDNPINQPPVFKDLSNVSPDDVDLPEVPPAPPAPNPADNAPTANNSNTNDSVTPLSSIPASNAPTMAELEKQADEAAKIAQEVAKPAESAGDDLDAAREAVSSALFTQPFNPANKPLESVGSQLLGDVPHDQNTADAQPPVSSLPPLSYEPTPVQEAPAPQPQQAEPTVGSAGLPQFDLPPLPPMPPMPQMPDAATPGLPDMPMVQPGQPAASPFPQFDAPQQQPPTAPQNPTPPPSQNPDDPAQFRIPGQ